MTGRYKGHAEAAARLRPLLERFDNQTVLIFAPGPSLPKLWRNGDSAPCPSIAVGDAWRITPWADVLYHSDAQWWRHYHSVPDFGGLRVGCHECGNVPGVLNLELSGTEGFDPRLGWLRHGSNSGAAAIHLAAQLGARRIVLLGFDQRQVDGQEHFFGLHPRAISRHGSPFELWARSFALLADELRKLDVEVLNATPNSALTCFPRISPGLHPEGLPDWALSRVTGSLFQAGSGCASA